MEEESKKVGWLRTGSIFEYHQNGASKALHRYGIADGIHPPGQAHNVSVEWRQGRQGCLGKHRCVFMEGSRKSLCPKNMLL